MIREEFFIPIRFSARAAKKHKKICMSKKMILHFFRAC